MFVIAQIYRIYAQYQLLMVIFLGQTHLNLILRWRGFAIRALL